MDWISIVYLLVLVSLRGYGLDVEFDVDVVANEHATGFQSLIERQTEILVADVLAAVDV
jgi:hypothetical protein